MTLDPLFSRTSEEASGRHVAMLLIREDTLKHWREIMLNADISAEWRDFVAKEG